MSPQKLAVIGWGNMADAVIAGALKSKVILAKNITVLSHRPERDLVLKKKYGVQFVSSVADLLQKADAILLAVKPQSLTAVLPELKSHLKKHTIWTVAAGWQIQDYKKILGPKAQVIRLMPNTAAFIGLSATGLFAPKGLSKQNIALCESFFAGSGQVIRVSQESDLDRLAALSGCGPAYVFAFLQSLIEGGLSVGLSAKTAQNLAALTLSGATRLFEVAQKSPQDLIKQVASKKGMTEAALNTLHKKGWSKILSAGIQSAHKRSAELARSPKK